MGFKAISTVFTFPVSCKIERHWWNFQNPPVCKIYSTLEIFCRYSAVFFVAFLEIPLKFNLAAVLSLHRPSMPRPLRTSAFYSLSHHARHPSLSDAENCIGNKQEEHYIGKCCNDTGGDVCIETETDNVRNNRNAPHQKEKRSQIKFLLGTIK